MQGAKNLQKAKPCVSFLFLTWNVHNLVQLQKISFLKFLSCVSSLQPPVTKHKTLLHATHLNHASLHYCWWLLTVITPLFPVTCLSSHSLLITKFTVSTNISKSRGEIYVLPVYNVKSIKTKNVQTSNSSWNLSSWYNQLITKDNRLSNKANKQ